MVKFCTFLLFISVAALPLYSEESRRIPVTKESIVGDTLKEVCRTSLETREIILETQGSGCELLYVKSGKTQSLAKQLKGSDRCKGVFDQIKKTLSKSGFICDLQLK